MSEILEKWGAEVAGRGFAQVPNYLLLINQFLEPDNRLSPIELLVLIQLVGTWWKRDEMPFPSMTTLATRCGISDRQVQRTIGTLETKGFIKRTKRRNQGLIASNSYDLSPSVNFLKRVAEAFPNNFPRRAYKIRLTDENGDAIKNPTEEMIDKSVLDAIKTYKTKVGEVFSMMGVNSKLNDAGFRAEEVGLSFQRLMEAGIIEPSNSIAFAKLTERAFEV